MLFYLGFRCGLEFAAHQLLTNAEPTAIMFAARCSFTRTESTPTGWTRQVLAELELFN